MSSKKSFAPPHPHLAAVLVKEDGAGLLHIWIVLCGGPVLVATLFKQVNGKFQGTTKSNIDF